MLCFICQTLLVSIVLAVVFVAHHRNYGYDGQQIENERIIWVCLSLAIVMQFVNSKSMSNCNAVQTTAFFHAYKNVYCDCWVGLQVASCKPFMTSYK